MFGDECSTFFSRSGSSSGTNGAMSDESLMSAHKLDAQTVAFLTSS